MFEDLSKLAWSTSRDGASGHQSVISPLNPAAAFPRQGTPNPNKCTEALHLAEQGHSGSPQETPGCIPVAMVGGFSPKDCTVQQHRLPLHRRRQKMRVRKTSL